MTLKELKLPILPVSALIFYIATIILWKFKVIPEPSEILRLLQGLYENYGFIGLVIATFLESIVYLGLYFPGSLIIALAVFFSDGSFMALSTISMIVAAVLTLTAVINFFIGRYVASKSFPEKSEIVEEAEIFSKGVFVSMLHPNLLAFFFFGEGLERRDLKKLIYVPLFMVPYGYLFGLFLYKFSEPARARLEDPDFLLVFILIWIVASFIVEHRRTKKKGHLL